MNLRLAPLAVAVSSALLTTQLTYADGGSAGTNGSSFAGQSNITDQMIGTATPGAPGLYAGDPNGGNGPNLPGRSVEIGNANGPATTITGTAGSHGAVVIYPGYFSGGAGAGGNGGASVIGGITQGGAGGYSASSANAGHGGNINGNAITVNNITLDGSTAAGGDGGGYSDTPPSGTNSMNGGLGSGGHGGGSIYGGISQGGAAGFQPQLSTSPAPSILPNAQGGNAGSSSSNTLTVNNTHLLGASGGNSGMSVHTYLGGIGSAGHGGGSIFAGLSQGGAGGLSFDSNSAVTNGGNTEASSNNFITINNSSLTGATGGNGGESPNGLGGGSGDGGLGGGSVFGGLTQGGAGGLGLSLVVFSNGGNAGAASHNTIELNNTSLIGATGGSGSAATAFYTGALGSGGHGGGSVFGGISVGGNAGFAYQSGINNTNINTVNGGDAGNTSNNRITLTNTSLKGAAGGNGSDNAYFGGSSGFGGYGGGSVFGGISQGGNAGATFSIYSSFLNGGHAGDASDNNITLANSSLIGAVGGNSGDDIIATPLGLGGHGGGSIFGGISQGGSGGKMFRYAATPSNESSNGGNAGETSRNTITVINSHLTGANGGSGTTSGLSSGADGYKGGSIFGGLSRGGAGGYTGSNDLDHEVNGGDAGDSSYNTITLAGVSSLSGDIYGGYSQGGAAGSISNTSSNIVAGISGLGGKTHHNSVTLQGEQLTINGRIAGGWSLNGDSTTPNADPTFTSYYQGNSLNPQGYRGAVQGIYHFENYNWILPKTVINQDTLIHITGSDLVEINNTKHSVALYNDGNPLYDGDQVIMIDKVQGTATLTTPKIRQGQFLVYDASLDTVGEKLILSIKGEPSLNHTAKTFLEGRTSAIATLNQGADMVSDYVGNTMVEACRTNVFAVINGGSNRYDTGSHIKVRDTSMALGTAHCFEMQNQNTVMLGVFAQHGNSHYDSYNHFAGYGDTRGWGKVHYTGGGVVFHMNVAGTGSPAVPAKAYALGQKDGLYVNASASGGKAKTSFNSDLIDPQGARGKYNTTSNYASTMAGTGYIWQLDEQQMLDIYGRYNWSRLGSDHVMIGNDPLKLGNIESSRVRLGARYSYALQAYATPYAGLAYEHEFKGNASGSAYGMSIDEPTLKGNSGMLELGVNLKPSVSYPAWSVNFGVQGHVGERRGISGGLRASYDF